VDTPATRPASQPAAVERKPFPLAGWHVTGNGTWRLEADGTIVGQQSKSDRGYTHLVTDRPYRDFTATLKFKAVAGNSGFYFRIAQDARGAVKGFQAEIDATRDVGGIFESGGRGWVSHPTPEQVATYFKPGEWNEMTVTARGPDVVVRINGTPSAEIADDTVRMEGPIALQMHGGQHVHVMFKDIEIREE
jgi:hypothetical protein